MAFISLMFGLVQMQVHARLSRMIPQE